MLFLSAEMHCIQIKSLVILACTIFRHCNVGQFRAMDSFAVLELLTENNNKEMLKILKMTKRLIWKARAVTLHILRMTPFFTYHH